MRLEGRNIDRKEQVFYFGLNMLLQYKYSSIAKLNPSAYSNSRDTNYKVTLKFANDSFEFRFTSLEAADKFSKETNESITLATISQTKLNGGSNEINGN